jgi:peptide chain release factor 2
MTTQEDLEKIQNQMANPDFWQNKERAQKTLEKYNNLKKQLEAEKNKPANLSGKYDTNNCLLTISAGTGGVEACDWAEMLSRMYLRYGAKRNYQTKIISISPATEAGIKSISIEFSGQYIYGYLKNESGIHRLVRISPFDADKARHTSFALVEVIPIIEEVNLEIPDKDLRIDVFRARGHGGQSVNTTDSAVRITHIPSGITASCQNERSQFQNKTEAMKIIKSRIRKLMDDDRVEKISEISSQHIGTMWGGQVRSYFLDPYKLVKDHRTLYETKNVDKVLNGEIQEFIDKSLKKE